MRILTFFVLVILGLACSSKQQKPLISGLMWGGEGSRLVVKPVGEGDGWADTILIDHLGEFEWRKDSIAPGFYRLENFSGAGMLFLLERGSEVYVDAQYINYPEASKVTGSDIALEALELEKISNKWLKDITPLTQQAHDSIWLASEANRRKLTSDLDSVRMIYRDLALEISDKPLVRFLALHQNAGNISLFEPWTDRQYFFQADTALQTYKTIPEIRQFFVKIDSLRRLHFLNEKIKPGTQFPLLSFPNMVGDTISTQKFKGIPVYIEIWNPSLPVNARIHASVVPILNKYRRPELEVYMIAVDTATTVWKDAVRMQNLYYQQVVDSKGVNSNLFNDLGIIQLPSNFLIDANGIVVAKNIWGRQLDEGIELLLRN